MSLDPESQAFLDMLQAANLPPYENSTVAEARERMNAIAMLELPAEPVTEVHNLTIPGPHGNIPIRVYSPSSGAAQPTVVYFHGGGWVIGSLDSHDRLCRSLANASGFKVISVDYRLAPEHKYPAAVDDAEAAFHYIRAHASDFGIDPAQLYVGGDSAGGNLSAVVCQRAFDNGMPLPAGQVLIYPATGHHHETASKKEFANGFLLTAGAMDWFAGHYLSSGAQLRDPSVSPFFAQNTSGLPPTFVLTAEYDPLRDEGEAYAVKLQESGVSVLLRRYDGMIHGFIQISAMIRAARTAILDISEWLRNRRLETA